MTLRFVLLVAFASACASGAPEQRDLQGPAAGINQSERLLAQGRKLRTEKGCAAAAPTFRVIASFGDGHEVAQSELGACLLEIAETDGPERALFKDEGLLWLRRAAWGGEARAQRALASLLSGAPHARSAGVSAAPEEALGWALVYEKNAAHKLYGLDPLDERIIAHLQNTLPPDAIAAAERFAAEFAPIAMASFTPPARERTQQGRNREGPASSQQRRRRPR